MQEPQFQPPLPEQTGFREIELDRVPTNPNNPPWNSLTAFAVWCASVLLVLFVPTLLLLPYLFSKMSGQYDPTQIAEIATKDPVAVFIQVAAILPVHIVTLLLCWFVVTNFRKFPFLETLGWRSGGMRWWHYVVILAAFLGVMIVVGAFMPEQENDLLRILKSSKLALYTIAFLAVFTAPLIEEVVYRGVLYSAFQRSTGTIPAVIIVTFLFALVHVPQYYPSYSTILLLTLLSLILTLVRVYTGNLLPCIILHTIFNALQSAFLVIEPDLPPAAPTVEKAAAAIFHLLK